MSSLPMIWKNWVRWILTVALLVGVFSETGLWTTIVLALLAIRSELEDLLSEQQEDRKRFLRFVEDSIEIGTD